MQNTNSPRTSIELVRTHTTNEIWKALDITRKRAFFTLIFGETGRGKTLTATHWAGQNDATMIRCMTGTTKNMLMKQLTRAVTGTVGCDTGRIIDTLCQMNRPTIIIDEANHMLAAKNNKTKADALNSIRDVYDYMHDVLGMPVGVALIFTSFDLNEFMHGSLSELLEQFIGRMGHHIKLPSKILIKSEVAPIVKAYVPDCDDKLLKAAYNIASGSNGKIRTLVKYLCLAKEYVEDHKGTINAALLESLRDRYESGGLWPEE